LEQRQTRRPRAREQRQHEREHDGTAAHTLRAALAAPAMALSLTVLGLLVAAALVLVPALAAASATAALRGDLDEAGVPSLDLTAQALGGVTPGPGVGTLPGGVDAVWGRFDASLRALRDAQPQPLASVLADPGEAVVLESAPVGPLISGDPVRASQLALAADPDLTTDVRPVEGALPGPPARDGSLDEDGEPRLRIPIALDTEVAAAMEWPVGERRLLALPPGGSVEIELTGTVSATDEDAAVWTHITDAVRPAVVAAGAGGTVVLGTGFVDPASLPRLAGLPIVARTLAWYSTRVDRVESADAELLAQQARTFTSREQRVEGGGVPAYSFVGRLPRLLDDAVAAQTRSDGSVWTAASGPAVGGAVVLALVLTLLARSRAPGLALLEARGASTTRRRLALAGEAGSASLVGVIAGGVVGVLLSLLLVGTVVVPGWAVATAGALVLVSAGAAALTHHSAIDRRTDRLPLLRLLAEALLLLVAVAAVLAVVQEAPLPLAGVLAPGLVALTVAVAAARLLPALLPAARRRARRGTGPLLLLASSRSDGALVVVAIAGALAIALFSGVLLTTVRADVSDRAVVDVGADLSVRSASVTAARADELRALPGVAAMASVGIDDPVTVGVGASREPMRLVVVDTAALQRVQEGLVGRLAIPDGFAAAEADGSVPVIASRSAAATIGDAGVTLRGRDLDVVATADDASPLTSATTWLLVDEAAARELRVQPGTAAVVLVRLDDPSVADAVRTLLGPDADVETSAGVAAERLDSPRLAAEQTALVAAVAGGVASASAALLLAGLASAGARRRRAAALAALGMPRSRIALLDVATAAPPAVIGTLAGVASGLLLPVALVPLLVSGSPAVRIDPAATLVTLAAFLLAAAVTVLASALAPPRGPLR
ncbi:hypothetical protein C5C26_17360, partial [Rathayibacter sp. AY2B1]|uniref:FtsX-like permease family protein n=1 Tax=Rathayibacter sp. AY2B1 TaxID=2080568 RepID=UPI000D49CE1F